MIKNGIFFFFVLSFVIGSFLAAVRNSFVFADNEGVVIITVKVSVCGDGVKEGSEDCDNADFGESSCQSEGFSGGDLSCTPACELDTGMCAAPACGDGSCNGNESCGNCPADCGNCPNGGSGGGGGGGGGGIVAAPSAGAVFSGRAYPGSTVTLLKDAQIAAVTVAGPDAQFQINISGISAGGYIFSLYGEDSNDIRSPLFTFPITVTRGVTTNITGIFIAPTIATDKSEVKRGDNIVIFGQAAPASEVTVSVNSEEEFFVKKMADATGAYLLNFDTSVLEMGQHQTKSKAALNGEITAFGKMVGFMVGTKNVAAMSSTIFKKDDLNKDGKINLVDFSIAAYWYKRANPPASADLNSDGKIDLVDLSIMAFNWTG